MKRLRKYLMLAAALLAASMQAASAQTAAALPKPILYGTIGACDNLQPGGPCTQTSTLVQIDPTNGALLKTIGPVGYTVNGLAWDRTSRKLYASTAIGDVAFHGLITINTSTGAGTPVDPAVHNFGLPGADSPIHSIAINPQGKMVAWYDEFPGPDTFVTINKLTGVATEFPSGIDTFQNGLAFQAIGPLSILWNMDAPKLQADGTFKQTAYVINPTNGKSLLSRPISPPTMAALGDFNPFNLRYYGLRFTAFDPTAPTSIIVIDTVTGKSSTLGTTVPELHVIAFVKP